ncbi:MAG: TetR/AcrR family transcriptional regulator [Spirochaetes bacterium]|nr:TetR/AcrR family transcriptional regulator [Spirochaetota bacterium]MBU0956503.1 TetR/AcrR family transcriptional regulator [Spirochaetota bacterium]
MSEPKDSDKRREQFLDAAQALFTNRGYEETTVAAIIDSLGMSKGAFYHYFGSKEDLLDALAERQAAQVSRMLQPLVDDKSQNALQKLNGLFNSSVSYKAQNREFILELMRIMYDDRNLRLRKRMETQSIKASVPLIAAIISQGMQSGEFNVTDAEETASLVLQLGTYLSDRVSETMLRTVAPEDATARTAKTEQVLRALASYCSSMERILGAPAGSIQLDSSGLKKMILGTEVL